MPRLEVCCKILPPHPSGQCFLETHSTSYPFRLCLGLKCNTTKTLYGPSKGSNVRKFVNILSSINENLVLSTGTYSLFRLLCDGIRKGVGVSKCMAASPTHVSARRSQVIHENSLRLFERICRLVLR